MKRIEADRHGELDVTLHVAFLVEKDKREACPQRSDLWYAKRANHLTASAVASVAGENPYETRKSTLRKKIGLGDRFTSNAATAHGNLYEDVAIELYEKRTGEKVLSFGLLESLNANEHFIAGSPDGITASGRLIEVKCPFRRKPNGIIPSYYVHQVQTLMNILNLDVCDFIEYVPGTTWTHEIFQVVTIYRDRQWWSDIFPQLAEFWRDVEYARVRIANGELEEVDKETSAVKRPRKTKPKEPVPCLIQLPSETTRGRNNGTLLPSSFLDTVAELLEEMEQNGGKLKQRESPQKKHPDDQPTAFAIDLTRFT